MTALLPTRLQLLDPGFVAVDLQTALGELIRMLDEKHQAIICLDDDGRPIAVLTVIDAIDFITEYSNKLGGLVDLNDHTVDHQMKTGNLANKRLKMDDSTPSGFGSEGTTKTTYTDCCRG